MENKKYLTEENYERGKKKLKTIALVILILGILIGGSLILTGIISVSPILKASVSLIPHPFRSLGRLPGI